MSSLLFGAGTFILLARGMDKPQYGAWMLYLSVVGFIEVARIGLLKNPLIREAQKAGTSFARVQAAALAINLAYGLLITGILFTLRGSIADMWGAPELHELLEIYFFGFWAFVLYSHLDFIQSANLNFRGNALGIIAEKGVFFIGILALIWQNQVGDIRNFGYLHLGSVCVGVLVSASSAWRYFKIIRKPQWATVRSLLTYGKYTLGTNLGAILLRSIDTWMIGILMNPAAVATYNVAMRVASLFEAPTQALAQILFPKAVHELKREGSSAFKRLYERSVSIILLPTIPFVIGVMIFAESIVSLLAGPEYIESANILRITILFGLLIPFNKQLGILLDADGKAKLNMLFVFRNALVNTALNFILINYYGVLGAAVATALTFSSSLVLDQRFAFRTYGVTMKGVFYSMNYWIQTIKSKINK